MLWFIIDGWPLDVTSGVPVSGSLCFPGGESIGIL